MRVPRLLDDHVNMLNGTVEATYSTFNTDNLETPAAFWERAFSLGRLVQDYATSLVRDAAAKAERQVAAQINSAYNTMHMVVVEAGGLKNAFADLRAGASFNDIQNDIEMVLTDLLEELKEQFPAPDRAPNHAERRGNVSLVLEKVEEALIDLGTRHGIAEQQLRIHIDPILKHVGEVVITLGSSPFPFILVHPALTER